MFNELILGSGGIHIVHKIGALRALNNLYPLNGFTFYTGCSAGSILSYLIVIGYSSTELEDLIVNIDLTEYQDLKIQTLLEYYGMDDGTKFYNLFKGLTLKKNFDPHFTFAELFEKTKKVVTFCVANLSKGEPEYHNLFTTPNAKVLDSLMMSMNIPIVFKPIKKTIVYKGVLQEDNLYIDGGIYDCFPYSIMKKVPFHKKLGIFTTKKSIFYKSYPSSSNVLDNFPDYAINIINSILDNSIKNKYRFMMDEKYSRNIFLINDVINSIDFAMSEEIKKKYIFETDEAFKHFYQSIIRKNYLIKKYTSIWKYKSNISKNKIKNH